MKKTFNTKKYGKLTVTQKHVGINYVYTVDKEITREEAAIVQEYLDYHPAGYGLYNFEGKRWTSFDKC